MIETFISSLGAVLQPSTLLLMLTGIAIGFVVGILPGLGGAVTLALMLPFTFGMEPVQAFAFLLGMWVVTSTTGDVTSVLFGIPGEVGSAATVLDGYPMTRSGQAGRALGAVLFSSLAGAIFGALVFALTIPVIRPLILAIGPPEYFMLTLLGLTFVVGLSGRNLLRGFIMALLGFLVAMVGLDTQAGIPRYTFDQLYLWDGVQLIPLVVGLFGGAEILQLMLTKQSIASSGSVTTTKASDVFKGLRDVVRHRWVVLRSSAIGVLIGAIPGMGGTVAQFLAYGAAQQRSKEPERFGKGAPEGIVAAGAVNNAKDSGSVIPTVAFGIPGSVGTAILLGAFLIAGLAPGPDMLTEHLDVTFSMVWTIVLANLVAVVLCLLFVRYLARLTFIPGALLVPGLMFLLTVGAYTTTNSMNDIVVMLAASALGVIAIRWDWPRVPFVLAAVLGSVAERYLFLSHGVYQWGWFDRPGVLIILAIILAILVMPIIRQRRKKNATSQKVEAR